MAKEIKKSLGEAPAKRQQGGLPRWKREADVAKQTENDKHNKKNFYAFTLSIPLSIFGLCVCVLSKSSTK